MTSRPAASRSMQPRPSTTTSGSRWSSGWWSGWTMWRWSASTSRAVLGMFPPDGISRASLQGRRAPSNALSGEHRGGMLRGSRASARPREGREVQPRLDRERAVPDHLHRRVQGEAVMMDGTRFERDADFFARARRHLINYGGTFVPFVATRAEGAFVFDAQGRRVLD